MPSDSKDRGQCFMDTEVQGFSLSWKAIYYISIYVAAACEAQEEWGTVQCENNYADMS